MRKYIRFGIEFLIYLVCTMFILNSSFAATFQIEWDSLNVAPETWTQISLENSYDSPVVVATPQYQSTTQPNGISVWVTNVTSNSFLVRTSDENFAALDTIPVHYMVMEEGSWTLPDSGIQVEAGSISTNKVGSSGAGNWVCPTNGDVVTFATPFTSNPLVLSTRGSDNNPNAWATTFQNDPANEANSVPNDEMCIGLSQSKAVSPGTITNDETIYYIATDEGNGTIGGVEFEVMWNEKDTGDSGGNWINGYADSIPFTQSWVHTWTSAPTIILASQTTVGGADGSWPVIYDVGNSLAIEMFVDEANERAHSGSESGGGWAFTGSGSFGNFAPQNLFFNRSPDQVFVGQNFTVNATVIDGNGNNTIVDVYSIINGPNSSVFNVTLTPEIIDESLSSNVVDSKNYSAKTGGDVIGETGNVTLKNRESVIVNFTQTYNSTPVIIGNVVTQNNDDSPFVMIVHSINTTHANLSLCRDNGATTCDNSYVDEVVNYAVFDVDIASNYSWIDVGFVSATSDGSSVGVTFSTPFGSTPYVWAQAQEYGFAGDEIAPVTWFNGVSTTGANLIACDHRGAADACAGSSTFSFGYVAIDPIAQNISNSVFGIESIRDSSWTPVSFSRTFNEPRVFAMTNTETGPQDPAYPWVRNVGSNGADVRYCETDGANYCDTHNPEDVAWFAIEAGTIDVGNGGDDIEAVEILGTYNDIFTDVTHNVTAIEVGVNVSLFNASGSLARGNEEIDIGVEMLQGTNNWVTVGSLNVSSVGQFFVDVVDSNVLDSWSLPSNRGVRLSVLDADYFDSTQLDRIEYSGFEVTVNYSTYTSNWSAVFTNTSVCGVYNVSSLTSVDNQGKFNESLYSLNVTIPCGPIITLNTPLNESKVIVNDSLNFSFSVVSNNEPLQCFLLLEGVVNVSTPCSAGNNSILSSISRGKYNWSIRVNDSEGLISLSEKREIFAIEAFFSSVSKRIISIGTNLYTVLLNSTGEGVVDYVDNTSTYGSFTTPFDSFVTFGSYDLLVWNSSVNLNYSVTNFEDNYIVGLG